MNPNLTATTSTNTGTAQYSGDSMRNSGDSREVNPTIENHLECKANRLKILHLEELNPSPLPS